MAEITYLQTYRSKRRRYAMKRGQWSGIREYAGPVADLDANLALLSVLSWTVGGIAMTPRDVDVDENSEDLPGQAVVTLRYAFGDNPYAYRTDAATLSIQGYGTEWKPHWEVKADGTEDEGTAGKEIETDLDKDGISYKPLSDSTMLRSEAIYLLRLAVAQSTITWATYEPWIGKKTSNALTIGGNTLAAAGELLLQRVEIPEYYLVGDDDPVVPLRFVLLYRRGGFGNITVGKYKREAQKVWVYHNTDVPGTNPRKFVGEDGEAADGTGVGGETAPTGARSRIITYDRLQEKVSRGRFQSADMSSVMNSAAWTVG